MYSQEHKALSPPSYPLSEAIFFLYLPIAEPKFWENVVERSGLLSSACLPLTEQWFILGSALWTIFVP